jgi:hypothetical protein
MKERIPAIDDRQMRLADDDAGVGGTDRNLELAERIVSPCFTQSPTRLRLLKMPPSGARIQ